MDFEIIIYFSPIHIRLRRLRHPACWMKIKVKYMVKKKILRKYIIKSLAFMLNYKITLEVNHLCWFVNNIRSQSGAFGMY